MADNSQDYVAAKVPAAYLRNVTNHRDAVLVAKRFCECGASTDTIERIAWAIEHRAIAQRKPMEA